MLPHMLSSCISILAASLPTLPSLQGWQAARARAGQLATRLRLAFAGGRLRRAPSAGGLGGGGAGGGAATGYRPLGAGRRRSAGLPQEEREESASEGGASLPSRLREVLVAGSFGSSFADVEGSSPPASARAPLLGPGTSSSQASPRSGSERSPLK